KAVKKGLSPIIPYGDSNPYSVEITQPHTGERLKHYRKLIKKYKKKSHVAVLENHDPTDESKRVLTPHFRIGPSPTISDKTTSSPLTVGYGRTATVMGAHYHYPPQNGTAPTIAIISLGGTYLTSDLNYYWTTIEGLVTKPVVKYVNVDGTTNA